MTSIPRHQGNLQYFLSCNLITCSSNYTKLCCNLIHSFSSLPGEWADNKDSLLEFIWAAHWGVKGIIRDSLTGEGIAGATVHVRNISRIDRFGRMESDITHDVTSGK